MIVREKEKVVVNDLNDLSKINETLKLLKGYIKMIDNGYKLHNGYSSSGKMLDEQLVEIQKSIGYIFDKMEAKENRVEESIVILPEPIRHNQINLSDYGFHKGENIEIEYQWVNEDYKMFLDTMQESYCTPCQVINWNGYHIDRSGDDRYMANKLGQTLKKDGFVTRFIVREYTTK